MITAPGRRREAHIAGVVLATLLIAAAPRATAQDLLLAADDAALAESVSTALAPWGTRVATLPPRPIDAGVSAAQHGEALLVAGSARVVVWLDLREPVAVLWVYDRETRAAFGRELTTAPPYDPPTAAAVALSLKSILRHSTISPTRPSPARPAHDTVIESTFDTTTEPAMESTAPRAPALTLELATGARAFATAPDAVELRLGIVALYWLEGLGGHVGIGGRAVSGPGIEIGHPRLAGRWIETAAELVVGARYAPIAALELRAELTAGLRVATVVGALSGSQRSVDATRAHPGASVAVGLGFRPARPVRIGLHVGADLTPWTQRYLVRDVEVLVRTPVALEARLALEVGLDP